MPSKIFRNWSVPLGIIIFILCLMSFFSDHLYIGMALLSGFIVLQSTILDKKMGKRRKTKLYQDLKNRELMASKNSEHGKEIDELIETFMHLKG